MLTEIQSHPAVKVKLNNLDDAQIMQRLGRKGMHPEGRFFPDTYTFPRNTSDQEILSIALQKMDKVLAAVWQKRQSKLPYKTAYEALIMASIIEKETSVGSERGEISGVFVRRLQKRMRLQTDPTVIYGLGPDFDGNLRRSHLKDAANPYNSYRHHGLPPTPIAMPGRASLAAAARPDSGETLYFVADGSGGHTFSKTLEEHEEAVRKLTGKR